MCQNEIIAILNLTRRFMHSRLFSTLKNTITEKTGTNGNRRASVENHVFFFAHFNFNVTLLWTRLYDSGDANSRLNFRKVWCRSTGEFYKRADCLAHRFGSFQCVYVYNCKKKKKRSKCFFFNFLPFFYQDHSSICSSGKIVIFSAFLEIVNRKRLFKKQWQVFVLWWRSLYGIPVWIVKFKLHLCALTLQRIQTWCFCDYIKNNFVFRFCWLSYFNHWQITIFFFYKRSILYT